MCIVGYIFVMSTDSDLLCGGSERITPFCFLSTLFVKDTSHICFQSAKAGV